MHCISYLFLHTKSPKSLVVKRTIEPSSSDLIYKEATQKQELLWILLEAAFTILLPKKKLRAYTKKYICNRIMKNNVRKWNQKP